MSCPKERPPLHYSVERHLNLNGCDTSLTCISTYSQVGRKCCFDSQRATLHAPLYKKDNVRSKGSESGKRYTRAFTSHVASGVENGQVASPFAEHTFDAAPRIA